MIKYIVFVISLTVISCSRSICPDVKWTSFKYGDKVIITEGFYKGVKVTIKREKRYYHYSEFCSEEGYIVYIDEWLVLPARIMKLDKEEE